MTMKRISSIKRFALGAGAAALLLVASTVAAQPVRQQIIVHFHPEYWESVKAPEVRERLLAKWSSQSGNQLTLVRPFGAHGWIVRLNPGVPDEALHRLIAAIDIDPVVVRAEEDVRVSTMGAGVGTTAH